MSIATKWTRAEVAFIKMKGSNKPYHIDPETGIMKFDSKVNDTHSIYMNRGLPQWWLDKLRSGV